MWNSLMHNVDVYIHFMHRENIYIYTQVYCKLYPMEMF